jgi:hypothetical protein
MNAVPALVVSFLIRRLEVDDDIDEDDDDEDDDVADDDDEDGDESDFDDEDEEPETWQVFGSTVDGREYPEQGTCACESPKRRLNLTFRPLTA